MSKELSHESRSKSRPELTNAQSELAVRRGRQQLRTQTVAEPWMRSASTSSIWMRKPNARSPPPSERSRSSNRAGSLTRQERPRTEENVLVDVLPSFEMYNTLHRHIPQGNVNPDCHDFPPGYQEVQAQHNIIMRSTDQPTETQALDFQAPEIRRNSSSAAMNNLRAFSTQHISIHNSTSRFQEDPEPIEDDVNHADNINIDKLYSLPKLATPVEVTVRITKHAPKPHEKPEEESILKEYTSGDIIHGYCIIENKSTQPLQFEMFYVTLEGYTSLIDKQMGKRTLKRFLRMVDLSASWSYSDIQLSTGVKVVPGDVDFDNSILGLNNNRILEPGVKYKKFFMFKLPNQLLDVTCKQEQFSHCLLPPSFGIDKFRNHGKYSAIKVNSILGFGHIGVKGSPIMTVDMVDENLSINYTVDARIVGKDKRTQKLNIMREVDYNIRVVPFAFCCPIAGEQTVEKQLSFLLKDVQKRVDALERIFARLESNEPIKGNDVRGTDIDGTVDDTSQVDESELLRCKLDQLQLARNISTSDHDSEKNPKDLFSNTNKVETQFSYRVRSKSSSGLKSGIFSSLLGGPAPTSSKNDQTREKVSRAGLIVITAEIPEQSLPYRSPSLLRKTNKFENKNHYDQENWLQLQELIPQELKQVLDHLDIELTCIQSNNSKPGEPPEIQSITTELICITAKSDNSIPVKLNWKLLMDEDKLMKMKKTYSDLHKKINALNKKFDANVTKLNELYNMHDTSLAPRELRFNDIIPSQLFNNVDSLANLEVDIVNLNDVFKKQTHTLRENSPDNISSVPSSSSLQKSGSNGFLSATFSGSSSEHSRSSSSIKFVEQIVHEWNYCGPLKYKRNITVNLQYNDNLKETLVPNFESCLCSRFYCVRVNIKFEHRIGTATIDIPVEIKSFHNI
ncbi:related to Ubiquitin ligase-binding protein BUL2 [Zygosaccharomyces bailii]|nr:related to Ubiquitin ligase-binding protein BUL2 [Zygosaccharomyces bailii]